MGVFKTDLIGIVFLGFMSRPAKKNETDLLHALAITEEQEREYLARQIHSVNTLLSFVKINLKKAVRHASDKEMLEQLANENYHVLEECIRSISLAVRELSPPMFSRVGYVAAMAELCRKASIRGERNIRWEVSALANIHLAPPCELQLYRLSKELLQCLMHEAGARNIHITIQGKAKKHHLRFNHDGKDIQVCATRHYSMEARALLAGVQLRSGKQWVEIQIGHGKNH